MKKKYGEKIFSTILFILVLCSMVFVFNYASDVESEEKVKKEEIIEEKNLQEEYELLSAYIEIRNKTNKFGGIIRQDKYLHYSILTGSGKVLFKEKRIHENYKNYYYEIEFKLGDENKLIQKTIGQQTKMTFVMTADMYKDVFKE